MLKKITLYVFILLTHQVFSQTEEDCPPEEVDGLLVFEAERFELKGDWKIGEDTEKASGGKYIYFDGPNSYGGPKATNNISYTFKINNPGTYSLKWTMRQPEGEIGSDLGNDAWIYFSDDIGRGNDNLVLTQFYKFVGRSSEDFTLNGQGEINHDSHGIKAVFATAGEYTLNLSGRSHHFQVDRIVLSKGISGDDLPARIALIEETNTCENVDDNPTGEEVGIVNPFTTFDDSTLEMPLKISYEAIEARKIKVDVAELNGTVIKSNSVDVSAGTNEVDLVVMLDTPLLWGKTFKIVTSLQSADGTTTIREALSSFSVNANKSLNNVTIIDFPEVLNSTRNVIKVKYEFTKNRDITLQLLRNSNWRVQTIKFGNIPAGSGEKEFVFNLKQLPPNGTGYVWRAFARVFNQGWPGNLDLKDTPVFRVDEDFLSVDDVNGKEINISAYPNPFEKTITIDLPNNHNFKNLEVFDIQGKTIFSKNISNFSSLLEFDLDVEKGLYLMKLEGLTKSKTIKLIKI